MSKRILSIILSLCMVFSCTFAAAPVSARENTTKSAAQQKSEIQSKLNEIDKKLKSLGSQSEETEEYIDALNEKIKYLNEQLNIAKNETKKIEEKVTNLEKNISVNEQEIKNIKTETAQLEETYTTLNEQFEATYESYCGRIKALYVSGSQSSIISFLLESDGVQNLLTRYEMVRSVSKHDGELLEDVKEQTEKIVATKDKLDKKNTELSKTRTEYKTNEQNLKNERTALLQKQDDMAKQQDEIAQQQVTANALLKRLNDKTKEYGEYRDITQAELDEIDADIEAADKKYPEKPSTTEERSETTTERKITKKRTTTTTKRTTSEKKTTKRTTKRESSSKKTTTKRSTTKPTTKKPTTTKRSTTTTTTTASSQYLSLTYPCPKYTTITCGFGAYSGHTGCDFSTRGHEDQKIVAAESGTVILVKLLNRSYGHYLVIRHDKKTRSGKTVYTLYAHNNDIIVSEGQYVKKGQKIANSGTTGNSTGPHCHFEVRVGGSSQRYAVNPASYLP